MSQKYENVLVDAIDACVSEILGRRSRPFRIRGIDMAEEVKKNIERMGFIMPERADVSLGRALRRAGGRQWRSSKCSYWYFESEADK